MSIPTSRSQSNSNSLVSNSESLVESSSEETPRSDEQSKSSSPPVLRTKSIKSAQREAYKANPSSSTSHTEKNHDIGKN